MKTIRRLLATTFTLLFALLPLRSSALTNGNFEASPFSTGWTVTRTPVATPGIAPGSVQGARFTAAGQALAQNVSWTGEWQLESYFAIRNTAGRAYSVIVSVGGQNGINLRGGSEQRSRDVDRHAARTAHVNNGNGTATETWTANGGGERQFMRVRVMKP